MNTQVEEQVGPSRRTVARTAAWAVPVLATSVGAPAFAASGACTDQGSGVLACPPGSGGGRHHHGGGSDGCQVSSFAFTPGTLTASVQIAATRAAGSPIPTASDTGTIGTTPFTPSWKYLTLHFPQGMQQGDTLTLTLTLSKAVSNFTFTVTDIDKDPGSWIDEVFVDTPGYTYALGSQVTGTGAPGNPFIATDDGRIDDTDAAADGNAVLTWPGSVSAVTIRYVVGDQDNGSTIGQHIGVGQFAYDDCPAKP